MRICKIIIESNIEHKRLTHVGRTVGPCSSTFLIPRIFHLEQLHGRHGLVVPFCQFDNLWLEVRMLTVPLEGHPPASNGFAVGTTNIALVSQIQCWFVAVVGFVVVVHHSPLISLVVVAMLQSWIIGQIKIVLFLATHYRLGILSLVFLASQFGSPLFRVKGHDSILLFDFGRYHVGSKIQCGVRKIVRHLRNSGGMAWLEGFGGSLVYFAFVAARVGVGVDQRVFPVRDIRVNIGIGIVYHNFLSRF